MTFWTAAESALAKASEVALETVRLAERVSNLTKQLEAQGARTQQTVRDFEGRLRALEDKNAILNARVEGALMEAMKLVFMDRQARGPGGPGGFPAQLPRTDEPPPSE